MVYTFQDKVNPYLYPELSIDFAEVERRWYKEEAGERCAV